MSSLHRRAFAALAILFLVMASLLFTAAGTLYYWQGWTFLAVYFAASIAMDRFSLIFGWPAKSASLLGRRAASNWRSSSRSDAETMLSSRMKLQCTGPRLLNQLYGSPEQ